jgi:PAS domain S-box-containing protein
MAPDGTERWFRDVGQIVPDDDGTLCWQGVMLDITERRSAVAALRSSEELFRSITESSADLITILDGGGRFTYVSPSAERVLGWSREEIVGTPLAAVLHPDDARAMSDAIESLKQADGRRATLRFRMRAKSGAWRTFEGTGTSMLQDPTIAGIVASSRDITEQLEAEHNLRFQAQVLNAIEQAAIASNTEGKIVYVNRRAAALFGWDPDEVIGQDYVALAYPAPTSEDRARLHLVLEQGASSTRERLLRKRDGSEFLGVLTSSTFLDEHGKPAGVVAIVTDITERRQLEEQLRQAQKMEAIGQLAGGVAHDFNNILTVISGRAEFLRDALPEKSEGADDVGEILQASARGSRLTRQLLAFSRKQMLQPKLLELDRVVEDLAPMLNRLIGEDIELVIRPGAGQRHVRADPGQLEQVLVNLVVNARDAMPSGGVLVISTRGEVVGGNAIAARDHQLVPGEYLVVAVSDTGVGIDPTVMPRIFEPFFTTKGPGQGTGLGLSTVYGIAKQSGGAVNVRSQMGRGTTFDIFFPAAPESRASVSTPSAGVNALAGSETILLVEDSEPVRAITERVLRSQGYRVLTASTGPEALQVSRAHDGRIDLLLTDVVMPRMSGRELSETLLRDRPSIRTLYMSGYTDDVIIRKGLSVPGAAFLEKPFTSAALAQRVRHLLDEQVSSF